MEASFFPVLTIENEEELEMVTRYCDEYKIEIRFLEEDLNKFPAQVLIYIDKNDFDLFLKTSSED